MHYFSQGLCRDNLIVAGVMVVVIARKLVIARVITEVIARYLLFFLLPLLVLDLKLLIMATAAAHDWCEHHQKLLCICRLGRLEGFTMGDEVPCGESLWRWCGLWTHHP